MNGQAETGAPTLWSAVGRAFDAWTRRARDRRALAQLTARERLDLGLSRCVVDEEIRKPIWRA